MALTHVRSLVIVTFGLASLAYAYLSGGMAFTFTVSFGSPLAAGAALVGGICVDGVLIYHAVRKGLSPLMRARVPLGES